MTLEYMTRRCDYWLKRLDMGEWLGKVTIVIKPDDEMEGNWGRVSWEPEECLAYIEMRADAEEDTLVHEIIHFLLRGHQQTRKCTPIEERVVNRLSSALTELDAR